MSDASTFDDPRRFSAAPTPASAESRDWPAGWWLVPAVGFGLWFWIKLFAWMFF